MKSALVLVGSRSSVLRGWKSKASGYDLTILFDRQANNTLRFVDDDMNVHLFDYELGASCDTTKLVRLIKNENITSLSIVWAAYDGSMLQESYSVRSAAVEGFWSNCGHPVQFIHDLMSIPVNISCVFIGSIYGGLAPNKQLYTENNPINPLFYGVYKAGLAQAAKWLSAQSIKCRVNCLMVGPVPKQSVRTDKEFVNALTQMIPGGSLGEPMDVVNTVFFLLSEESRFIRGQSIYLDGGYSIW